MTIEIQRPELEALILERMQPGAYHPTIEDALLQALKSSPLPSGQGAAGSNETAGHSGAALVAAMQASPLKEIARRTNRRPSHRLTVPDVAF
jgi:hypothetical protein